MRAWSTLRRSTNNERHGKGALHRALQQMTRLFWWSLTFGVVVASAAWIFADRGWLVDILANLTAQIAVVWLIVALRHAALRRWRALACVAIAAPLLLMALAPNRAERTSKRDDSIVRVLAFNTFNEDRHTTRAARILDSAQVDAMAIIEPTAEVVRLLKESESFRERYPYVWPARPYTSRPTIVSRWPIEGLRLRHGPVIEGQPNPGMSPTGAIIQRPGGAFVLIATHPVSPRSREAWENGNEAILRLAPMVLDLIQSRNLPIVIGGDFNSTPTGWRSRYLHEQTGLLRGKPLLMPVGTWPNGTLWPARLAIDDVFVSATIRVLSWTTLPAPEGSDHSPVRVELLIPFEPPSGPNATPAPPDSVD